MVGLMNSPNRSIDQLIWCVIILFVLSITALGETQTILLSAPQIQNSLDNNKSGMAEAFPVTASSSGHVNSHSLFLDSSNTAASVWAAVYASYSGNPDSSSGRADNVSVTVSPSTASLQAGQQTQFTATVRGTHNKAMTWTASGGTVTSGGQYTAPSSAGTYTLTATSVTDSSKSASAVITVSQPSQMSISVSPGTASLQSGGQQQFTAYVSGTSNTAVTWAVTHGTGTITQSGLYTAPQAVETDIVVATSQADSTESASASITVVAPAAGQVAVSPTSFSFGNVVIGSNSALNGSLTASSASVTVTSAGLNNGEFVLSGISLPATLTAGQSAPFTVTFTPQTSGATSASLSFSSNASNSPAVQSMTGTGTAATQHTVDLTWNASTSAVGYNVYRSSVSGGPYSMINTSLDGTTAYTDSTVVSGQTYYYVATAVDGSSNESGYSNQAQAVIPNP